LCLPNQLTDVPRPNMSAKVTYKADTKTPKGIIRLLNPPQDLVGEALTSGKQTVVLVKAGYDGVLHEIFSGSPISEGVKFTGGGGKDATLELECSAGGSIYQSAMVTISNTGRLTAREVVNEVARQADLQVYGVENIPENFVYPNGFYATSNPIKLLQQIADHTRTTAVVIGSYRVAFHGDEKPPGTSELPFFDQEQSGVIGTPTMTDKGLKFRTLLRGNVRVGEFVAIRWWDWTVEKYVTSTIKVSDVTFTITTYGQTYYNDIVGKEVQRAV